MILTPQEISQVKKEAMKGQISHSDYETLIAKAQAVKLITEIEKQSVGLNFADGQWCYLIPKTYVEKLKQEVGL